VSLKRQHRIIARHPAPIIRNAQKSSPARLDINLNRPRARVNRVLDQLLSYRRRSLDDLARGDLVGKMI
jgi:hypothetical protein